MALTGTEPLFAAGSRQPAGGAGGVRPRLAPGAVVLHRGHSGARAAELLTGERRVVQPLLALDVCGAVVLAGGCEVARVWDASGHWLWKNRGSFGTECRSSMHCDVAFA